MFYTGSCDCKTDCLIYSFKDCGLVLLRTAWYCILSLWDFTRCLAFYFLSRSCLVSNKVMFDISELSGIPLSNYMSVLSRMVFRSLTSYYSAANSLVFGPRNWTVCRKLFAIPYWYCSKRCLIFPSDTVLGAVWYSLLRLFYEILHIPFWDCSTGRFIFLSETVLRDVSYFHLRLFYEMLHISMWDCSTRCFIFPSRLFYDFLYFVLRLFLEMFAIYFCSTRCLTFPSETVLRAVWHFLQRQSYERDTWYFLLRQSYELFDIPFKFCLGAVSYSVLWLFYEMWPL